MELKTRGKFTVTRQQGEGIELYTSDGIIRILSMGSDRAKISIDAPLAVRVLRSELGEPQPQEQSA